MYYLTLAMHTINITQKPGGSYSHPNGALDLAGSDSGIDFFFCRVGYLKCIGEWGPYNTYFFQPCNAAGVPVKVRCADGKERIVTIALTHSQKKYIKSTVGKIYSQGQAVYEEGHLGGKNLSGNHIHCEVATGTRTKKYYDSKLNVYRMSGELDPSKVFFIDTSFSKIKSLDGLSFKTVTGPEVIEKKATAKSTIPYGYHIHTFNGSKVHTYRARKADGYTLHLLSAGDVTKLLPITSFDSDKIAKVAVLNCNYFDQKNRTHYGVEQDGLIQGYKQAPKSSGLLVYYIDKAGNTQYTISDHYWLDQEDVQCAFTPYAITMMHGDERQLRSTNLKSKASQRDTQSAVARLKNGEYVLAAFTSCYPKDVRTFFQAFTGDDVQDVCILDSGGSTQLRAWVDGKMQTVVTGDRRRLPNVLCLAKEI